MEHLESQLPAADITLPGEVLDRIDEIMAPGVMINPADNGWVSPALQPAARRREPAEASRQAIREGNQAMEYTHLAVSDLKISRIALGCRSARPHVRG
jgi:hypothetical protein